MKKLLLFISAMCVASFSFSQVDPETDCPAPETFLTGVYQIADVNATLGPDADISNFTPGLVTITASGNTRSFQNGVFPIFDPNIKTIVLNLNCGVIQISDIYTGLQCTVGVNLMLTTTDVANSTTYSLSSNDASFIINYIEDPLGSCGGPFTSSFSLTKTCSSPQNISFTNATDTTVDLNWIDVNNTSSTTNTYTIEYGLQGFTPGSGQSITGITGNTATINNLTADTEYDFYIFGSCSGGSTGEFSGSFAYANFVNSDFFVGSNGVTCLCPDADFGDVGTLNINGQTKTFTKRTENELRILVDTNENDPQIALTCTSGITDMSALFELKQTFNQNIDHWDVGQVTDMNNMFNVAVEFNQPLNNWDVSQVTNMGRMFSVASSFNQPLDNWDVYNVTDMSFMFIFSRLFNQPLNNWNVGNVINMAQMLAGTSFNYPLNTWDVSQVTDMNALFAFTPFDQPINNWNVSNVTDMSIMFRDAAFNQPLNDWDVSSVVYMAAMFRESAFNQPLNGWDVSNVTNMSVMFYDAALFNQDISGWCVAQILEEPTNFALNSPLQTNFFPNWGAACGTASVNDENLIAFNIYPNPVNNWLTIDLGKETNAKIIVHDLSGKLILEQNATSNIHTLNISNVQSGMYMITVNSEERTLTKRIIKQ